MNAGCKLLTHFAYYCKLAPVTLRKMSIDIGGELKNILVIFFKVSNCISA